MHKYILIVLLFLSSLHGKTIELNENSSIEILSKSKIFLDKTKSNTFDDILKKKTEFFDLNAEIKSYGYSNNFNIWIKFKLYNLENKTISKILEFDNPLATDILLFENNKLIAKEGLLNKNINRSSLNPIFKINLKKKESKTYYMKISTKTTALSLKLNVYSTESFYKKEVFHQVILSLFFGAMTILALYNLAIFFIVKDISYLYYVGYILTLVFHHLLYVGFATLYIFDNLEMKKIVDLAPIFIALPVLFLVLFLKTFLRIEQYRKKVNLTLNILIFILITSVLFFIFFDYFAKYRNTIPILVMIYLFGVTLYTALQNNLQARMILFGWAAILLAGLIMYLSSSGIIHNRFSTFYIVEIAFVFEALIFSIALANRIKKLLEEKNTIQNKLIEEQKNIENKLNLLVKEKTHCLKISLEEQEILLKELNHRVKNNMQTIISLVRLQNNEIDDLPTNNLLLTLQNRISAISHIHELLYINNRNDFVDGYKYFEKIIFEIKKSYYENTEINYNISCQLSSNTAIYCGLIINELVTNSFKHGFDDRNYGVITISLFVKEGKYSLLYYDNGKGYSVLENKESLGLTLIAALATKQLKASLDIVSRDGVNVKICWKE